MVNDSPSEEPITNIMSKKTVTTTEKLTEVQIETGIPIPPSRRNRTSIWGRYFRTLEPSQSFVVPFPKSRGYSMKSYWQNRLEGRVFEVRQIDDPNELETLKKKNKLPVDAKEATRIWRVDGKIGRASCRERV